jgi:hypothetical protein
MTTLNAQSASYCYLPDELLLEVLVFFEKWEKVERQTTLARVAAVNRYIPFKESSATSSQE